jgi:hypothetical protein
LLAVVDSRKAATATRLDIATYLTTETVEGTALALKGIDNVKRGDGLALSVLGVGDGVTDNGLEEGLEDTTGLFVDHGGDTLDTATASETADSGLGDSLDVVTEDLTVTLGAALAETLATFSACIIGLECVRVNSKSTGVWMEDGMDE